MFSVVNIYKEIFLSTQLHSLNSYIEGIKSLTFMIIHTLTTAVVIFMAYH